MGDKRTRAELTADEIVEHAVQLAKRDGMDIRMRDLADRLNTWPNAIYGHFPSKPDLQEAMVNRIIGEAFDASFVASVLDESEPWRDRFRMVGFRLFRLCADYSGLGKLLTYDGMGAASGRLHLLGAMVHSLSRLGISERDATITLQTAIFYLSCIGDLFSYYRNSQPHEQALAALSEDAIQALPSGFLEILYDYEHETRAQEGIQVFIHAIEHMIEKAQSRDG